MEEEWFTVCDSCFTRECFKGEFYCDDYKTAGTCEKSKEWFEKEGKDAV